MILIDVILLIVIYLIIYFKKWKKLDKPILILNTLMYVYVSFVAYFTLMPVITSLPNILSHPYTPMDLVPFDDYINDRGDSVRQILLNILMLIPFGFLLPIMKKKKLFQVVLYTFIFSLIIEVLQPLINSYRSSDITDIITNIIGGIIGYLIYLLFKPLVNRILQKSQNKC